MAMSCEVGNGELASFRSSHFTAGHRDELAAATSQTGRGTLRFIQLLQRGKRGFDSQQFFFQSWLLIDQLLNLLLLPSVQCSEQISEQVFLRR